MNQYIEQSYQRAARAMRPPLIHVDNLADASASSYASPVHYSNFDGSKFVGGFGATELLNFDYWTLRARSIELYNKNLYAQGIINAFVTNIINTGLTLDATPSSEILNLDDDYLNTWSENVEARFKMYCDDKKMCDFHGEKTYGEIQAQRELQGLVEGDVLTVFHFDKQSLLPKIQLIQSSAVQSPFNLKITNGHKIDHGVEFNKHGTEVAYWVLKNDGTYKRYSKTGKNSGRPVAHLYRPGKNLLGHIRGVPLLGNVLQSLKEIDRFRDSVQRKALVSSFIALAVEKDADTITAKPLGGAATRSSHISTKNDYNLNLKSFNPGVFIDDMPAGHKIKMMGSTGTDLSFAEFEAAIINAIAWTKEIPPEVIKKSFSSNYAASKQANAEFSMFLDMERTNISKENDHPFYGLWLYIEVLKNNITAKGLLEAWHNPNKYAIKGAWCSSDWSGSIKPNADLIKEGKGWEKLCENGFATRSKASKSLTNTKYSTNIKRLKRENEMLANAMRPILNLQAEFGKGQVQALLDKMPQAAADPDPQKKEA
jgi:lambda family phage portal protein